MAELKAGGLALIIGLKNSHQFNGKCVRLIKMIGPTGETFIHPKNETEVHVVPGIIDSWYVHGDIHPINKPILHGVGVISSKNLIPLDEDFSNEQYKERETNH
ncbi:hypothetical protein [Ewingella americana]|uniref:hypothetical protein n=1 Tax=Ewingella americana TaxID=41202 RepID=UPI0012ADE4A2|nr:hypothetical protein [Ewingella americana]MRT01902.1 hypothetical protein [Ewingella americana]